jgi:hypothetical protein
MGMSIRGGRREGIGVQVKMKRGREGEGKIGIIRRSDIMIGFCC